MAFYRCGGGSGIPSQVNTDMNNVLNKKFSTSGQTYPPLEWADDVNLLGLLEEKTASGAIANITDGADGVPIKNWIVTLPASLTGYSALNGKKSEKNLLLPNDADSSPIVVNGITRSYTVNTQTFSLVGTNEKTDAAWLIFNGSNWKIDGIKKGETYTFYHNLGGSLYSQLTYFDTNGQTRALVNLAGSAGKNNSRTFTIPNDFDRVRNFQIGVYATATDINENAVFMLVVGSSSTAYAPYTAPEVLEVDLGRTIYGGTADIITGEGVDENDNDFTFTPITPTPDTALGVNNFWADEGDSDVTYRSSGTVTPVPVVPTLITKTITENDTYYAEDDNADGYSEVIVNVQGGSTPFVPQFSETLIADNTSHAASFTLTEDYGNYDMVKIVWYESASSSGFLYTTPDILDEIFSIGVGKLCINKPSTNYYACYTKSGLTWTRSNQRVIDVHEIYGVTFTNCTMTATDLYKRGASTTTKYAVTSQTSLKDYDLFMMSSIHATDGSETMPATWLYQYPPENMSEAFSCPVPAVLQEYNANDEAFVISEYGMTAARFFMVQGITFTPSTSNLLSMGGLTSSNEEPDEPENNEEEEEE